MKKLNFLSSFSAILILTNLVSCSPNLKLFKKKDKNPDLGYIVHAEKEDVLALVAANSDAEVKIINEKAKIFEVKGLNKSEIEKGLQGLENVQIEKNVIIHSPVVASRKRSYFAELFSDANEKAIRIPGFNNPCKNNPFNPLEPKPIDAPTVAIDTVNNPNETFHRDSYGTIVTELDSEIKLTAKNSKSNSKVVGPLNFAWVIVPADFSSVDSRLIQIGSEISFKADALGEFNVNLLVQDQDNSCVLGMLEFGVSTNFNYKEIVGLNPIDAKYYDQFPHLKQMDIQAAWKNSQGEGVKVAVIDSGVNYLHPFLSKNIAINNKEIPDNGIDDDQNGFIDDVIGWDFVNEDNLPFDDAGHGTHVSGLIASTAFGVAPKAKIIPVKVFNTFGSADLSTLLLGFIYAIDQGADVINFSGGGDVFRFKMLNAVISYAKSKNVKIVVAAGNEAQNNDLVPTFPTNLISDNLYSVASSNKNNDLSFYSNFGVQSVKFAAPGGDEKVNELINSTAIWNHKNIQLKQMQGTSMSSPLVAGTIASMVGLNPMLKLNNSEIEKILISTMTPAKNLVNKIKNAGVISSGRATTLVKLKKLVRKNRPLLNR